MNSWYTIRARGTGAEVLIYDEIGAYGVSAKGFLAELGALPDGVPINLRLNSPGGSVFDAVAIFNALQRHTGAITVWIDGIAASAASYIAMAGDEIVMPENAFLMIHDPSGLVMGTAADMREMAQTLDKIAGCMIRGYAAKSGRSEEQIATLMAAETWFDAQDALDAGLATRMAEPVRIAASFDIGRFRNAPTALTEVGDGEGAATSHDIVPDENDVAPCPTADPASPPEGDGHAFVDGTFPRVDGEPLSTVAASNTALDPSVIRASVLAHARTVIDLCHLAGQPQRAGRFLEDNTSIDAVRASLLAAKAQAEPEITPHHPQPGRSSMARPWGDVIARTFKQKG
jgi:ATP-dependent Clp protease protease subunit